MSENDESALWRGKSPGAERTDKRGDLCTEEKNLSRQARGDILFALSLRLGIPCAIAKSRLTDAYAMHFVSRRALLFNCGGEDDEKNEGNSQSCARRSWN